MPGFVAQHLMAIDYTVVPLSLVGVIRSGGLFGMLRQLQKMFIYRSNIRYPTYLDEPAAVHRRFSLSLSRERDIQGYASRGGARAHVIPYVLVSNVGE